VRALVILYCYPPLLVPAAICYMKLMTGLSENGVEVEIVTITPDSFQSPGGPVVMDIALAAAAPAGVVNHEVHSPERSLWLKAVKHLDGRRRLTYRWLEPKKREWTWPALRYLLRQDLGRFDVVMTCSQPHTNHVLGLELQKRTSLPWIAYFSDPWTDSPYYRYRPGPVHAYNRTLEDRILAQADLVLFTCEEMKRMVMDNHPALDAARAGVLPHAFIDTWYGSPAPKASREGAFLLLQTGSFYGPRTPLPVVESMQRVAQKTPLAGRLRLDSYGQMADEHQRAIVRADLRDVFVAHGLVPYLESLALMKAHDALLLVDAPLTTTRESVFLPSKLVDYLGSRQPVIAVTPERGATARVVKGTGGIVCPLESPRKLDEVLLEIVETGRLDHTPKSAAIEHYEHRTVGASLARMMQMVITPSTAPHAET
jgi:hypothetical protein